MVLSIVLGEQWTYGFWGALIAHSLFFPAGVQQFAWLGLSWLFTHYVDAPRDQLFLHVHHTLMLWAGAVCGWLFVAFFRPPRFIRTDFGKAPLESVLLLGGALLVVAAFFALSLAGFFSDAPAFGTDTSVSVSALVVAGVVGSAMVAYAATLLTACCSCFGRRGGCGGAAAPGARGVTTLKYTVVAFACIAGGNLLMGYHVAIALFGTLALYAAAFGATVLVAPRDDTYFGGAGRAWRLAQFWAAALWFQLPVHLATNISDNCFAGSPNAKPDGCDGAGALLTVFVVLMSVSALYVVVLCALLVWRGPLRADAGNVKWRRSWLAGGGGHGADSRLLPPRPRCRA